MDTSTPQTLVSRLEAHALLASYLAAPQDSHDATLLDVAQNALETAEEARQQCEADLLAIRSLRKDSPELERRLSEGLRARLAGILAQADVVLIDAVSRLYAAQQ